MVITNLIGGLGNQMFQYAAGRALALQHDAALRVDVSGFAHYSLHQGHELHRVFCVDAPVADAAEIRAIKGWRGLPYVERIVARPTMGILRGSRFIVEPHFHYWNGIDDVAGDCYLSGYWQSEKYFAAHSEAIAADFTFRAPVDGVNAQVSRQICAVDAVSLHIRRGDYVSNKTNAATYAVCSLDYYRAAIRHVAEQVAAPHFFVFSDDIEWAKNNLKIEFPHCYVDHNQGANSYNDMRLMSQCQHHIIANSSFSWWGAWLNRRPGKIVVAPRRWFANDTDVRDLLPPSWVRL